MMKIIKIVFLLCTLDKVYGQNKSDFIIDYFVYKKVPNVIVATCNQGTDNLSLVREFNKLGITIGFLNLDDNLRPDYLRTYWVQGIFLDVQCFAAHTVIWFFYEMSKYPLFGEMHKWLVLGWDLDNVTAIIEDRAFGLSTDLVIAVPKTDDRNSTIYELYDVYNPWKRAGAQLNITHFGTWSPRIGLSVILRQNKILRRANLRGMIMKVAFFGSKYRPKHVPIEDYLQEYTLESRDGLSKFGYHIIVHLSEMFNISLQFGEVKVWKEGDTLGPMSRSLSHNEFHITGSPIIMSNERLRLVKFVYPSWPFRTCFIFRNPQPHHIKINEILRPFTIESWLVTFVFLIIFEITLGLSFRFEEKQMSQTPFSNSFVVIFGAMCQQGNSFGMANISTRMVFAHVLLFSLLSYNYYSACIMSVRLTEPIFKINDSLNELAKTDLALGSEPMVYFDFIMKKISPLELEGFYKNRWLKIPKEKRFLFPEKAIPLVRQGGFAYHAHPDYIYPIIDKTFSFREICELMEVHAQYPIFSSIAMTYNISFIELARIGFARMSEVGVRHRQVIKWSSNKPQCRNDIINVFSTDIYEFAPHLIILAVGIVFALITFIFEKIIYKYNKTRDNQDEYHHYTNKSICIKVEECVKRNSFEDV